MRWKFWSRANKKSESRGNDKAAAEPAAQNTQLADWFGFPGSRKELIALQRLVGNQTVLKLLAPEINSTKGDVQAKSGLGWKGKFPFPSFSAVKRQEKS